MTKTNDQNMFIFHKYQSLTTFFLLLFITGFSVLPAGSLAQNDPELIAKNLFNEGNFQQALPYYKDLVNLYPKDVMLNYYFAACLVETKQFTEETEFALQNASGEEVPEKISYYLGQFYHAKADFREAAMYYNRFMDEAKRKLVKETNVEELANLCSQGINPFSKPVLEAPIIEEKIPEPVETPKPLLIPETLKDSLISFQITPTVKYLKVSQFKEESSISSFVQGWELEQKLNKILKKTSSLRAKYDSTPETEKAELAETIILLEKETYELNQEANAHFIKAREKEIDYWDHVKPDEISKFMTQIELMEDSIASSKLASIKKQENASHVLELPVEVVEEIAPAEVQPTGDQIVYKIQIGAYSKNPPEWVQALFKKLSVIRKIDQYTDDKGVTVYTVGELTSFEDAIQMQSQVRLEGVKDAFVAAYKNGERITVKEAKKITEMGG